MIVDRRRKRSSFAGLALHYWFASVARRSRVFGLVLADSAGLLVASNISGPEADELAAMAPLLARPTQGGDRERVPYAVRPIKVDRTTLYLCVVGDDGQRHLGLKWAESGVHRILTTH